MAASWFSPRMWGCTCWSKNSLFHSRVFPTHVGVYRCERLWQKMADCFPHACGGVPPQFQISESLNSFSPRMWGCTDYIALMERNYEVFPTHVGVYLMIGDHQCNKTSFSPRMWGCTDHSGSPRTDEAVFPTHVGVYRMIILVCKYCEKFSPRMWGCT